MTTKELIQAELDKLTEEEAKELLELVKDLGRARGPAEAAATSFFSKLREIQIDGPEDFAENLDLYLTGELQLGRDTGLR